MNNQQPSRRLSVSSWSLRRLLGDPDFYGPENGLTIPKATHGRGDLPLLQLPVDLVRHDVGTLEICHFHLPSRDDGYLDELRASLVSADIELFSLLVDAGDVTDAEYSARDYAWMENWIAVAARLGARCMRVVAGKSAPGAASMEASARALRLLAERAKAEGVRLMTENWFGLLCNPPAVEELLDRLEGEIGLCLDFGNWGGPSKYADLGAVAARAESCHAKAHFDREGHIDRADYARCLELTCAAGFSGPFTLVYDGADDDEWQGLAQEREVVHPYLA